MGFNLVMIFAMAIVEKYFGTGGGEGAGKLLKD